MDIPTGQWHRADSALIEHDGTYEVRSSVDIPGGIVMNVAIRITLNGELLVQTDRVSGAPANRISTAARWPLRALDDLRVDVFQDSGQNVDFAPAFLIVGPVG